VITEIKRFSIWITARCSNEIIGFISVFMKILTRKQKLLKVIHISINI